MPRTARSETGSQLPVGADVMLSGTWQLAPDRRHLNHGAFGAVPAELARVQQDWRRRIEANPTRFYMDELYDELGRAVLPLAEFLRVDPGRLALVENVSTGIATILAGLDLAEGDRIITTSHGYGAVRNTLTELARRRGCIPVEVPLPGRIDDPAQVVEALRPEILRGARLVTIDHVTSPSALVLPVAQIAALCREAGVPLLVDGSHAPGMLDPAELPSGVDWYVGSCHKWLCGPRGVAFLVVPAGRDAPAPLVISHAYGRGFPGEFRKIGTRDPSAQLTVPATMALHAAMGGAALRARNRALAAEAARLLSAEWQTVATGPESMRGAMASLRIPGLPATADAASALSRELSQSHGIEVLCLALAGDLWLRLSAHAYNTIEDYAALAHAMPLARATLAGGAG